MPNARMMYSSDGVTWKFSDFSTLTFIGASPDYTEVRGAVAFRGNIILNVWGPNYQGVWKSSCQ